MNTPQNPDVMAAVDRHVAQLSAGVDAPERTDAAEALRQWFDNRLPDGATVADVERLAVEAGDREDAAGATGHALSGRILGVPYDFTPPTPSKIAGRLWDPMDPQLWHPHVFGIGWAPNLGAAAVRLGVIEPDGEDVPFEHTTERAFATMAALPVAVAAATALHYAVVPLPERLPRHWSWAGAQDRWAARRNAARADTVASLAAVAGAAWAATGHGSGRARAGASAASAGLAAATAGKVILSARPRPTRLAGPGLGAAMGAATCATLWCLARSGRAAEIRRDLSTEAKEA